MSISSELRKTIKYPTSLIVRGGEVLGVELAKSLLEQGGYVIIVDHLSEYSNALIQELNEYELFSFFDFSSLPKIENFIRRLDYVFFLNHKIDNLDSELSSQEFLEFSKFLDQVLSLTQKFDAKFLATTSIKAHQYSLDGKEVDSNFKLSSEIHTVYKESEFQRYIESLTYEYIQKSSLDARIIRLGEIIGNDIEYSVDTMLGRLVKEAILEDEITIHGDGLSSDYYVHIFDAVYGIIKAQFAKNTRGEVFSLAYEYDVSTLSIAYKLNEFLDFPKEIIFSSESEKHNASLKLYKPAPNLMRVGWKPRITFERALRQTFEYAQKIFDIHHEEEEEGEGEIGEVEDIPITKKKPTILDKIKWLFFVPEDKEIEDEDTNDSSHGGLGRLMNERKSQEKGRKGSIVLANRNLQYRLKKQEDESINDSISNVFISKFDSFTNKFESLRYITIRQFSLFALIFVGVMFLYVNIFSVIISYGRNMFMVYIETSEIHTEIAEENYSTIPTKYENVLVELDSGKQKFEKLSKFLGKFVIFKDIQNSYNKIYSGTEITTEGIQDAVSGSEGVEEYISEFDPQIIYRPNSSSLLAIENIETYSESINKIDSKIEIVDDGIDKIELGKSILESVSLSQITPEIDQIYKTSISDIDSILNKYSVYGKTGVNMPELIAMNTTRNYAFILVDNTNYLPAGGYPVSLLNIQIKDGGIQKITSEKIDSKNYSLANTANIIIDEINLVNESFVDNETGNLDDLFYLQQGDLYLDEIARVMQEKTGDRLDGVFVMNLNFLLKLLNLSEGVEYEKINFDANNFLVNFDLLIKNNPDSIDYRSEVLSNMFAISIQSLLNDFGNNFTGTMSALNSGVSNKDLVYKLYNLSIPNKNDSSDNLLQISPDYISIVAVSDPKLVDTVSIPAIKAEVDVLIREDLSSRKTITINYEGIKNLDSIVVCVPAQTTNFSFGEEEITDKVERFSEVQTCIRFNSSSNSNISFSFDTPSLGNTSDYEYNYQLGMRKQSGLDMEYTIRIATGVKKISSNSEGGMINADKLTYIGSMDNDLLLGLKVE